MVARRKKMDLRKEYEGILAAAAGHLELLTLSGVSMLPPHKRERREAGCAGCSLHGARIVKGEGSARAGLMFVGGAPGDDDVASGRPFSGPAGELLTKIINAMKLNREDVYLCYALRCRSAEGAGHLDEEISSCRPFLEEEIQEVSPRVIVAFGELATRVFLGSIPFNEARGRFHTYGDRLLMPTYGPATLLKRPELKGDAWKDIQMVIAELKKAGPRG
jgi:uracil-DNA glycosylase